MERNLADELGRSELRLRLFDRFADAVTSQGNPDVVGSDRQGAAAASLVTADGDVAEGPIVAPAGVADRADRADPESKAAAIAVARAEGLRRWGGIGACGMACWNVHAEMDADHGDWTVVAPAALGPDAAEVEAVPN